MNLSLVLIGEEVSPGNEKSCLNYYPRDGSGFGFKEIALRSGMCNGDSVHHTFRYFVTPCPIAIRAERKCGVKVPSERAE